ncbi:hypothetical protein AC233_00345 [Burkholderia sp. HB1]|nr:hypothetical protein AC233_00345 [Burkholderia sp. HB1]
MSSNDAPLLFEATKGDLFTFTHGEYFGVMYPSRDMIGLDEWVWRISTSVLRRLRNDAGELLEVKAETVIISEGYAATAAEAAYDMRACLRRTLAKAAEAAAS